ncbi:MAG: polysaccharide pyruvyl transferase family protein [Candidatus Diapherotrites archaeon]
MYGGMWREYNPGCFLVGYKTYIELKKRLPTAEIDLYAIDNKLSGKKIIKENKFGHLELNFFSKEKQIDLLDNTLVNYDAIVLGGDIVWGGDDVVEDNEIFFVNSPKFLSLNRPKVLVNCVHTFYDENSIIPVKEKFIKACARATYISIRTKSIQKRLKKIGITKEINHVPDIVLDLEMNNFKDFPLNKNTKKTKIGISIRAKLKEDLIQALHSMDLNNYEVFFYPWSKQYSNLETVLAVKKEFGNKFNYLEKYLNPLESYKLIQNFDISINDTFHGTIAAIIQKISFISIDIEPELTSRKDQLLESLNINKERNIRIRYNCQDNAYILAREINKLLAKKFKQNNKPLNKARKSINKHFDKMAEIIRNSREQ